MSNPLTYDRFLVKPSTKLTSGTYACFPKLLDYFKINYNSPTELHTIQKHLGITYPHVLGSMVRCKPLFTGKGSFFWLSELGWKVALNEASWDIVHMIDGPPLAKPLIPTTTTNPINVSALTNQWVPLTSGKEFTSKAKLIYDNWRLSPELKGASKADMLLAIRGLIASYDAFH